MCALSGAVGAQFAVGGPHRWRSFDALHFSQAGQDPGSDSGSPLLPRRVEENLFRTTRDLTKYKITKSCKTRTEQSWGLRMPAPKKVHSRWSRSRPKRPRDFVTIRPRRFFATLPPLSWGMGAEEEKGGRRWRKPDRSSSSARPTGIRGPSLSEPLAPRAGSPPGPLRDPRFHDLAQK